MIWKTLGFQFAAIGAVVAAFVLFGQWGGQDTATVPAVQSVPSANEQGDDGGSLWSPGPEHDPQANAARHWQKHRGEFPGLHSESDYVNAAHAFVSHPPPGALTKRGGRGDTLIYDPNTNTFAVRAPDGAPRTMFHPNSGRAYWERQ